jgi:hypothetical protein
MKHQQTLYAVVNHIDKKIIQQKNKQKGWSYGYDKEHDVVVISKTGQIGEVYQIQNLKIALPKKPDKVHKFDNNKWEVTAYPKDLKRIQTMLKENKGFGFIIKASLLILLALITCTCSGVRLMWGSQSLGKPIDYSIFSGKLVKQTTGVMECAISKTDVQDFLSWRLGKRLTLQQYHQTHALGYCPNLVPMLKKCSQIKLYLYPSTTHSSSSQFKMEWIDQKQNLPIEYQPLNLPGENLPSLPVTNLKNLQD